MKIKKQSKKRLLIIGLVAASLLILGGIFFFLKDRGGTPAIDSASQSKDNPQQPENNINYDPPTPEEEAEAERQKQQIINEAENPPASNGTIHATITRAGQSGAGQPLAVRVLVEGTTSGTCTITLSKAGQATITRTFPVIFEATSSSCGQANIEASSFSVGGAWSLSVSVADNNTVSEAAKTEVNIAK